MSALPQTRLNSSRQSRWWKDLSHPDVQIFITMRANRFTLQGIGDVLGLSRQRIYQVERRIIEEHGIQAIKMNFQTKGELCKLFCIGEARLKSIIDRLRIEGVSRGKIVVYSPHSALVIRKFLVSRRCKSCGDRLLPSNPKEYCSNKKECKDAWGRWVEKNRLLFPQGVLYGFGRKKAEIVRKLQALKTPRTDTTVVLKEAARIAGIGKARINRLRREKVLKTVPGGKKAPNTGEPMHLYFVSELEVVREVYAHNP